MKLKDEKGSVLALAIVGVALLGIFFMTINLQINNQIKSNNESYEDIKYKYMAEAGIEKAIYDIEKNIKIEIDSAVNKIRKIDSKINNNHENCPKVEFNKNGVPLVGHWAIKENSFSYLIYKEILYDKINPIYNNATFNNTLISLLPGHELLKEGKFRKHYEFEILASVNRIMLNGEYYNHTEFEKLLNEFIEMVDVLVKDINKIPGNNSKILTDLNKIKESTIEIKCRLGMSIGGELPEPELKSIKIPKYVVSLAGDNLNSIDVNPNNNSANIYIQLNEDGELENVNLTEINNMTDSEENKLISESEDKHIEARVNFNFIELSNGYDIRYKINSYEQKSK